MAAAACSAPCGSHAQGNLCRKMVATQPQAFSNNRAVSRRQVIVSAVATLPRECAMSTIILPGSIGVKDARHTGATLRSVHMASAATQGLRPRMEDTSFIAALHPGYVQIGCEGFTAQLPALAAAGVFDGHAGRAKAKHAARHAPHLLHSALTGQSSAFATGDHPVVLSTDALPPVSAASASLCSFDKWWQRKHGQDRSGSTAVMGIVVGQELVVANTGDSVAVLAEGSNSSRLTVNHRAENVSEMMRVLCAGGELDYDQHGTLRVYRPGDTFRLNGAMFTRSLGDFHFKFPQELLICEPHVSHHQLTPADKLVVMASDGVTDTLPDDDVLDIALKAVDKASWSADDGQQLAEAAAHAVMRAAFKAGSADNITAVAMLMDWS